MRTASSLVRVLALVSAFAAGAQAYTYTDSDSVPEPWSGWWWPMYHPDGLDSCAWCPHLWQGGRYGGPTGDYWARPFYDLDTRYFWRPESIRDSAQIWEYTNDRVSNETLAWFGHCGGASCAQAIEDAPPTDCGALSQDDLEGLLSEHYAGVVEANALAPGPHTKPGSLWLSLQQSMRTPPTRALVVDFYADTGNVESQTAWFWPVFRYEVSYDIFEDTIAAGVMTLVYEDHAYNADHASDVADYTFWCVVDSNRNPERRTGGWMAWNPPPHCPGAPDWAMRPLSKDTSYHDVNPYLNYDEIKRVIDHKTIILDDAYADSVVRNQFSGDSWVRRPGYSDSCWAAYEVCGASHCDMCWSPRLGCDGLWSLYVWKTNPPPGEGYVDSSATFTGAFGFGQINQAVPPFDTWQLADTSYLTAGSTTLALDDIFRRPQNWCYTYYDAFRLECVQEGGDGGASAAAVALGDGSQRVRVTPNPVGSAARISFVVPAQGRVDIAVYDVTGRVVLRADQGGQRPGAQTATLSVAGLPTGTYMARVSVNGVNTTCRFVVCR